MTMNILAFDTATEQCSVALVTPAKTWAHAVHTARGHADIILGMIDATLQESGLQKNEIDALAFGRGPGSFTGVRIAVGVAQGLSFALQKPVVGISNLAAVAQRIAADHQAPSGFRILICMDARMQEVYWGIYEVSAAGTVTLQGEERVDAPAAVSGKIEQLHFAAGTGLRAYPELQTRYAELTIDDSVLPRALEIAQLAAIELAAGRGVSAIDAQPVYLRDQVVAMPKTQLVIAP